MRHIDACAVFWSCVVRLAVCVDSWDDAVGAPGVLECCGAFVRFVPRILSLFFLVSLIFLIFLISFVLS